MNPTRESAVANSRYWFLCYRIEVRKADLFIGDNDEAAVSIDL